jgi:hypothetical protein
MELIILAFNQTIPFFAHKKELFLLQRLDEQEKELLRKQLSMLMIM